MQLIINCDDDSTQVLNLHSSFALEQIGRTHSHYLLTRQEIHNKAMITAQSIVGDLYSSHAVIGLDEMILEAQTLKARYKQ